MTPSLHRWSPGSTWILGPLLGSLLLGCAQFGVPELPPAYADPHAQHEPVLVAYDPESVLGFGHTAVLVRLPGGSYERYDHYASAELVYAQHRHDGDTGLLEGVTARLPSIFGLTREAVRRRSSDQAAELLLSGEVLIPLPGLDAGQVRSAALARWSSASGLEQESAPRYFVTSNNCHHFTRAVLRSGGTIPEDYFPKYWVAAAIARLPAP
jgi:hypothetical protein